MTKRAQKGTDFRILMRVLSLLLNEPLFADPDFEDTTQHFDTLSISL